MPRADLDRRDNEDERQHRAFLLWAMQVPARRSKRRVGTALGVTEKSIRNWHEVHGWEARVRNVEAPRLASDAYALHYHPKVGGKELRVIEDLLAVAYEPPPEQHKSPVAKAIDKAEAVSREEQRTHHDAKLARRVKNLDIVADAALVKVGQGIANGAIVPKLSDIGPVLRAFQMSEELEARRIALQPDPNAGKDRAETVTSTSQRVLLAQQYGGDVEAAMEEDAEELLLIIRTRREQARVTAAQAKGGVYPFPDVAEGGDG